MKKNVYYGNVEQYVMESSLSLESSGSKNSKTNTILTRLVLLFIAACTVSTSDSLETLHDVIHSSSLEQYTLVCGLKCKWATEQCYNSWIKREFLIFFSSFFIFEATTSSLRLKLFFSLCHWDSLSYFSFVWWVYFHISIFYAAYTKSYCLHSYSIFAVLIFHRLESCEHFITNENENLMKFLCEIEDLNHGKFQGFTIFLRREQ